jgi:hypothetical protein
VAGNIVADVLAASEPLKLIVLTEAKSGANIDEPQAKRYAAVVPQDVARLVTLPFSPVDGIQKVGMKCGILRIADTMVSLETNASSQLHSFNVDVPSGGPPRLIVLDADSPEEEFREILLPAIVAAASRQIELVSVQTLLTNAMPYFDQQAERAQGRLRDRASSALRAMVSNDFKDELRFEPGGPTTRGPSIRILRSPAGFDPRGETQGWQRWQRKAQAALRRQPRRVAPGQLSFEDLGLEAEAGEEL